MSLHEVARTALEYIRNAGGSPELSWFYDDHEPIGENLRNDLERGGFAEIWMDDNGKHRISLTEKGTAELAE